MMNYGTPNASAAAGTGNRTADLSPYSGICSVCLDGCPGLCEIGKSSFRGREVIYPAPFGKITAGAVKRYPVDYSHLNIQGTCAGATGIEADPDTAVFTNVSTGIELGNRHKVRLKLPIITGALGSTTIARDNWEGMAIGGAIAGIMVVIGENIIGMDPKAGFRKGRVVKSPELDRRVGTFKKWYDGYGAVVLRQNAEDGRLCAPEYAVEKLGVECLELKWGQMVEYDSFMANVQYLRRIGAKFVSLKTGAYRVADLARAMRFASDAGIDLLTIDCAGGGTGMSPWRMMNEWGIPAIYLQSLAYRFASQLKAKGRHVPNLAIAGGFSLEDHVFKALALGAPYFRAVCMGRATMIPAMVGKNIQRWLEEKKLPAEIRKYGDTLETIFVSAGSLKAKFGKRYRELPAGAIGMYTFCDRLQLGLQHLMAGARKFAVRHIDRTDLVSLTAEASEVTGIPYVMESDVKEARNILFGAV